MACCRPSLVRSLPRSIGRSVACSAVSCLDRACSYSRLQCDKRRMRPSPLSPLPPSVPPFFRCSSRPSHCGAGSRTNTVQAVVAAAQVGSFAFLSAPMLQIEKRHHQLCNTDSAAGRVSPYTRITHALTQSLAMRKTKHVSTTRRGCYLHRTPWFWVRSGYRSARRSRGLGPIYVNR